MYVLGADGKPDAIKRRPICMRVDVVSSESPGQIALYAVALGPVGELTGLGDTDQGVGTQGQIESSLGSQRIAHDW